ncbi:MAG TPA: fatty acid desaturase [Steroidobacteraceae bacterium]|nr:fatty acid desaturase [Steroidobacteraceae bacterium]
MHQWARRFFEATRRLLRAWPNLLVVTYTLLGWPLGIWMLAQPQIALNAAGVLLTAHTLICSAYLIHDCAHHAVLATASGNDRLGMLMSWINGACVADYSRLKKKHLRHHSDRLDVVTFDYRAALRRTPAWLRRGALALEWAYVPSVELLMRAMVLAAPFSSGTRRERMRVLLYFGIRLALFAALAWISVKALVLYALAYLIFLTVLRFMDAFQHTYEVFASRSLEAAPADPRRDLRYEYENTYSNLVARRWRLLNLLVLNFSYHNAHHVRPGTPWYRLPALHRSLYGAADPQEIACRDLVASFHRHRVARVLAEDYGSVSATGDRAGGFLGAVGVSFLTAV